jgi:hypothetical protein
MLLSFVDARVAKLADARDLKNNSGILWHLVRGYEKQITNLF